MLLPSLLLDPVFKQFFTSDLYTLSSLVTAFLYPDGEDQIEVIEILSPESVSHEPAGKRTFLDLKARDKQGTIFQIEVQVAKDFGYVNRALYYATGLVQSQLKIGDSYTDLVPIVQINLLDFVLFQDYPKVVSRFRLREKDQSCFVLTDGFQMLFVELPKFHKQRLDELQTSEDLWLYLLKNMGKLSEEDRMQIINQKPDLKNAFNALERYASDPEKRRQLEELLHADKHFAYNMAAHYEDGMAKGIEQGEFKAKLETARKLLAKGFSVADVIDLTGVTEKDLKEWGIG
jgi:predicted transposase/invertase (TIGR01784 family)